MRSLVEQWRVWAVPIGLVLIILGGKFMLIRTHGSDVPHWDQWDIEGELLIKPWVEGDLTLASLFARHNEHRPFFSRVWALGLFVLNGQWDARLEAVANALLHAAGALLLLHLLGPLFRGWKRPAFLALLILLFALPFNWENTVRGFQSQFYFLLLFTLFHLHGSLTCPPLSKRWWVAQAAGAGTLFCMGSGAVSAVVVLLMLGFKVLILRRRVRADSATAAAAAIILGAGVLLRVPTPWHDHLRPDSVVTFLHSFSGLLAWPFPFFPVAAVMLAPTIAYILKARATRTESGPGLFVVGLALWAWIQAAGLAFARGGMQLGYASRYSDLLAVGVIAGAAALAGVMQSRATGVRFSRISVLAVAWSLLVVTGVLYRSYWGDRAHQQALLRVHPVQIENIRRFIATGDVAALSGKPMLHIPYPDADRLAAFLSDPGIRSILPVSIRPPIPLNPDRFSTHGFIPDGIPQQTHARPIDPPYGSYTENGARQEGYFRSEPISPDLPMLSMTIAGTFALDQEHLTLIGIESAKIVDPLISKTPGARFMTLNSFRPAGPFAISVADRSPETWIAISNPVEMGFFSWLAKRASKLGLELMIVGAVLMLVPIGLDVTGRRRKLGQA